MKIERLTAGSLLLSNRKQLTDVRCYLTAGNLKRVAARPVRARRA